MIHSEYKKHSWELVVIDGCRYYKCVHCGCKATEDYAEKIGLDKLDIVDPCKVNIIKRKGNGG